MPAFPHPKPTIDAFSDLKKAGGDTLAGGSRARRARRPADGSGARSSSSRRRKGTVKYITNRTQATVGGSFYFSGQGSLARVTPLFLCDFTHSSCFTLAKLIRNEKVI